ncbi:MAG: cory-CC-star protein [Chromatiaceae bacterium]|jgi:hypothetical protein
MKFTYRFRRFLGRASYWLREYYVSPYRQETARSLRREEDLFMLLVYSEALGIPNPVSYYTLELQPILYESFHEWHLRMGMPKSPLEGFKCC